MARIVPGMRELLFGADAGGSGRDIKAADGAVTGTPSDAGSRMTGRKLIMSGFTACEGRNRFYDFTLVCGENRTPVMEERVSD